MRRLCEAIRHWYEGETTPAGSADDRTLVIIGDRVKRHWSAAIAVAIVEFHRREWKWALPFYLAVLGLLLKVAGMV